MSEQPAITQASTRLSARWILVVTVAVLLFGALLCFGANQLRLARATTLTSAAQVGAPARPAASVGEVRMQLFHGKTQGAGEALKAQQRSQAQQYRWVDRAHGIVHIPIDVAIELESQQEP